VGPAAIEILRQRYARGEIDAETFERMRARLEPSLEVPTSQLVQPAPPVESREPATTS
jgi:hypothetical protein